MLIKVFGFFAILFSFFPSVAFCAPIISTDAAVAITSNSAILNGTVNPNGSVIDYYYFEFGLNTGYGQAFYNSSPSDSMAYSANAFIKNLLPNTTYHFRVVAVYNSFSSTIYGSDRTFTTLGETPDVDIDYVYPSLGELNEDIANARIRGTGFIGSTRISLSLDSGNLRRIIGSFETKVPVYGVDVVDNKAYIAGFFEGGMAILDISKPTNPTMDGSSINTGSAEDIVVVNQKAYVVTGSSLKVVDVNPDSGQYRQIVSTVPMPAQPRAVDVSGNFAFVVAGNSGLQIVNLTTGTIVGSYVTGGIALGVSVTDNRAFVADNNGIQVVNISNVIGNVEPKLIGSIPTDYYCQNITISGDYAYATDYNSGTMWGSGSKLLVIDINPDHGSTYLTKIAETGILDQPWGVTVAGNIVYIATGDSGLQLVKINSTGEPPALNLSTLNLIDTPGTGRNIFVAGDVAYVADYFGGLQVVDISHPDDRPSLGRYDTQGEAGTVVLYPPTGDPAIAYVADASGGLQIIDVSNPAAPQLLNNFNLPMTDHPARNLFVNDVDLSSDGTKAYIITQGVDSSYVLYNGLHVIDVSSPSKPVYLYGRDDLESATGIDVAGDYAYVTLYDHSTYGGLLLTVDLVVTPLAVVDLDYIKLARDVAVAGSYAYVVGNDGLYVVNVGTPSNPSVVGSVSTPDTAFSVDVVGSKAYVADWGNNGGLQIINVSNPASPSIIGSVDTPGLAAGLDAVGNKVYVADRYAGVQVIDVSNTSQPVLLDTIETFGRAQDVAVMNGRAYIGDYLSGLSIIPVPEEIIPDSVSTTQIIAPLASPLISGHYTLRLTNKEKYDELHGAVTFTGEINLLSSKAIIVAGGGPPVSSNLIWTETKAYANYAYDNLIYQGYKHEDIYYLTDQYNPLHDRYDAQLVEQFANVKAATKANLQYAIETWAKSGGTSDLLIFMEDHGESERFLLRGGTSPQYVTADELDGWLDTLQSTLPDKVILVYDACNSGSFIARLTPPPGKTRLTLTSSTPDQVAYFLDTDHSFSSHFWSTFSGKSGNKAVMTEALNRAATTMATYQTAQLDANGDGVPNQPNDYTALEGHEGTIYALRRQYYYKDRSKPVVSVVSGDKTLNGSTSSPLMARSVYDFDGDSIERVWAEIVAPDFNPDITGQTVITLPGISLAGPDSNGIYQSTYTGFTKQGTYIISYSAEDSSGIYSLPKTSLVRQNGGTFAVVPDQYEVDDTYAGAQVIVVNDPSPQSHSFHSAGDEDWVKFYAVKNGWYTIKAAQPTIISDPIIQIYGSNGTTLLKTRNNAGSGVEESLSWQCPATGMYYVRMTNSSSHYGANVRYKLRVYNPYAFSLPGYVKGKVSAGGSGVAGAALHVGNGSTAVSLADGSYLMSLPAGSYGVNVSKAGYQSTSFSVTVPSGGSTTRNVALIANVTNSPPTINGSPLTTTYTYEWYSFAPLAADPNGDKLTFSITGKPGWASFNTASGILSGLPTPSHIGTYGPYTISVSDGKVSASLPAFTINVEEGSNLPPSIVGSPPKIAGADRLYSFTAGVSDPNGDSLSLSITNKPGWASFTGGRLSGIPGEVNIGKTFGPISIMVKDSKGAYDLLPAFSIQVVPGSEIDKYGVLPGVFLLLRE